MAASFRLDQFDRLFLERVVRSLRQESPTAVDSVIAKELALRSSGFVDLAADALGVIATYSGTYILRQICKNWESKVSARIPALCISPASKLAFTPETVQRLKRFSGAERLTIKYFRTVPAQFVKEALAALPSLRSFKLDICRFDVDWLLCILPSCSHLTSLRLRDDAQELSLQDSHLMLIAQACPALRVLHVHAEHITDDGVLNLTHQLPGLQDIRLEACSKVSDQALKSIAANCSDLRRFAMYGSDTGQHVTDQGLSALAERCTNLQYISLSGCDHVGEPGIVKLATCCPQLESLQLGSRSQVSGSSAAKLGHLTRLNTLALSNRFTRTTAYHYQQLAGASATLTSLDISHCDSVRGQNLTALVNLSTLSLHHCSAMDGENLVIVATACQNLQNLTFTYEEMSAQEMLQLAGATPQLQSLVMFPADDDCAVHLNDHALIAMTRWRHLHTLKMPMAACFNDLNMLCLIRACPLKHLDIRASDKVSDITLYHLVHYRPGLRSLNARGTSITEEGIIHLINNCSRLRMVAMPSLYPTSDLMLEVIAANALSLRELILQLRRFSAHGVAYLLDVPSLQTLKVIDGQSTDPAVVAVLADLAATGVRISYVADGVSLMSRVAPVGMPIIRGMSERSMSLSL
eukprot:TRINITY_DN5184_c0_g2_i1.p1 TRINITY_DN5184_c0_g2~~TRINITY_DN5184_c0_g2_i1.p1  ORF type:complete len:637 (+),score=134.03 TRINITY_DN5184_c0_g2_i1:61-1971(+)